jgi:hypothetical protein
MVNLIAHLIAPKTNKQFFTQTLTDKVFRGVSKQRIIHRITFLSGKAQVMCQAQAV